LAKEVAMSPWAPILSVLLSVVAAPVRTTFVQVAPPTAPAGALVRSAGQTRAVILIQGLHLHLLHHGGGARADLRPWQRPGSVLVKTLAAESDIFAFSYGQTAPVTEIATQPDLGEGVRRLRQLGYTEIALVGYSAGGLVARQLVEDDPGVGVTKVIQVCSPNGGAGLAKAKGIAGAGQETFLRSLTREARTRWLLQRWDTPVPAGVQFVCVVGTGLLSGDGIVSTHSQWPEDLQRQGVPAVVLPTEHWEAMSSERGARLIAALVRERQARWGPAQVTAMRKQLWGAGP
jgi:pimeloyl-ACP methyl ester carboxylesterase